ncbi:IS3 family transposase [Sorangium sp. So ce1128]
MHPAEASASAAGAAGGSTLLNIREASWFDATLSSSVETFWLLRPHSSRSALANLADSAVFLSRSWTRSPINSSISAGICPVLVLCAVLLVSRSGYDACAKRSESARAKADAPFSVQIRAVHNKSRGRYGSPRIHAELRARGMRVGKKRVERPMRAQRLAARSRRRFRRTTDSRHKGPIAPNVIERQFDAQAPNQVWVTDVTYIPTGEGWLYLAMILDRFSRRVVGWAASAFNDRALALTALAFALGARRPAPGLVQRVGKRSRIVAARR